MLIILTCVLGITSLRVHTNAEITTIGQMDRSVPCRMPACSRTDCKEDTAVDGCCNHNMFRVMSDIVDFLEGRNYTYGLVLGSLLGAVRSSGVIPWTPDVDLFVESAGIDALKQHVKLDEVPYAAFRTTRHLFSICENDPAYPVSYSTLDEGVMNTRGFNYYIDVYSESHKHVHKFIQHCGGDFKMDATVTVYGRKFRAPSNAACLLTKQYGDFMIPEHTLKDDAP